MKKITIFILGVSFIPELFFGYLWISKYLIGGYSGRIVQQGILPTGSSSCDVRAWVTNSGYPAIVLHNYIDSCPWLLFEHIVITFIMSTFIFLLVMFFRFLLFKFILKNNNV